ncbi:MAG: helix-turn-helix domain-containing protein [Acidobacteriota bacterium]|nr:helix-turn-helix domain-containing protein [Acidobacteriota bacterium]
MPPPDPASSSLLDDSTLPLETVRPRLLNMRQAAAYLGCSFWTARDYNLQGLIPIVDLPPLRPRDGDRARKALRRVLVDRQDLDAFIDARKRRQVTSSG